MVLKKLFHWGFLCLFLVPFTCYDSNISKRSHLIYWSSNNPDEIEFAQWVVNKWNSRYPEKQVRFQPVPEGRSSEEVILAAVVGKTTPDVYSNMWQGDVEYYAQSGVLVPLDTLQGYMTFLNQRCDSAVIAEVTSNDGHIYQLPWKINPIMLIYNEKFFEEIGYYQPPATYSEYLDAAKKFQADTDGDGYIDRWIGHRDVIVTWWQRFFDFYPLYLAASGGSKLIDNGRVVFNNKYAIQALKFLRLLYEKNYFSKEMLEARQDVFLAGVIATRFVGPWEIVHAEKFKTAGFRYHFTRLPVPDDHQGEAFTYGDPKNIVIFNTCKDPQRAWEFIKFMASKEMDLEFLKMATQLPRRKDLLQDEDFKSYFVAHPKMMPFAKQAKYVRGTDACAQLKEIFDIISQEYEACVIFDVKTPEQAMEDAARTAQVILQ